MKDLKRKIGTLLSIPSQTNDIVYQFLIDLKKELLTKIQSNHFRTFRLFRLFRLPLSYKKIFMEALEQIERPSKVEQKVAMESYNALAAVIEQINSQEPEIEIEETNEKIKIPLKALKLLGNILKAMSEGKPISIVPVATEVTTQKAAEMLGCSRPHLVKLLDEEKIEYTKVGRHRRIRFEDILKYKEQMKRAQKEHIIDIMNSDEEIGLYDS